MGVHTLEIHEVDIYNGRVAKTTVFYEIKPPTSTFNPADFFDLNDTQAEDIDDPIEEEYENEN